jgi:serine/threonine-protein kinase
MLDTPLLNDRYQLEQSLGTGGMAVVYKAYDRMLERTVAIKVLREDYSSDPAFRDRFHQEAKAAANLSHPNIVTIHDFGLDAGRLFIVMEFLPGTDLKSLLRQHGRLDIEEGISLMIQACAGVGYAHRAGLVHCDIKPHNMIVTPDRRLKVTDFGIARALSVIHPEEAGNVVWGSPQYYSPEQAAGNPPSPASDVYSLGIVMYEVFTGQLPFIASTATELGRLHREVPPAPPSRLNPAITASLDQIVLKILSKEPSARYRTADQLGRVLMTISRSLHQPLPPLVRPHPSKPRTMLNPLASTPDYHTTTNARPEKSPYAYTPPPQENPSVNPLDIDWITWGLGLLAFIALGGLIPLWLWIYFLYNRPSP